MISDPILFTDMEWVLAALATLIALVLLPLARREEKGSPFAERDEEWFHREISSLDTEEDKD
ncbi:MAG: hypothetical protein ABJL55_00940 [Roseibium sp.]